MNFSLELQKLLCNIKIRSNIVFFMNSSHGHNRFELEVDFSEGIEVFKHQLLSLAGVDPDRQRLTAFKRRIQVMLYIYILY
jgi:hypothetical protein